jgi:ABC-type sugar transport system ATPase subunit
MDEPLSNLDALLRESMRGELKELFGRLNATVLYVTHDQGEALGLSDEILVLKDGQARQTASPLELYRRPADLFTATFVGSPRMSVLRGRRENGAFTGRGVRLPLPEGPAEDDLHVGIRPEDVDVAAEPSPARIPAKVTLREPAGDRVLLTLRVGEESLRALASSRDWPETVFLRVAPERIHVFSARTEKRLEPSVR